MVVWSFFDLCDDEMADSLLPVEWLEWKTEEDQTLLEYVTTLYDVIILVR